jgi:WD40 repeat protein
VHFVDLCSDIRSKDCTHILNGAQAELISNVTHAKSCRGYVTCVASSTSGDIVVYGSSERFLVVWYVPSMQILSVLPTPGVPTCVKFNGDNVRAHIF